jgi:hypothetical protein
VISRSNDCQGPSLRMHAEPKRAPIAERASGCADRLRDARGVLEQDCDDDGETAAGGRLLKLLSIVDVVDVCVVVSRWYGGVHLGPDRFKDINNAARTLLGAMMRAACACAAPATGTGGDNGIAKM